MSAFAGAVRSPIYAGHCCKGHEPLRFAPGGFPMMRIATLAATLAIGLVLGACEKPPNLCEPIEGVREVPRIDPKAESYMRLRSVIASAAETAMNAVTPNPSPQELQAVASIADRAAALSMCLNAAGVATGTDLYNATLLGSTLGVGAALASGSNIKEQDAIAVASAAAHAAADWETMSKPRTAAAILKYLERHDSDASATLARRELRERQNDEGVSRAALAAGTADALKIFLLEYPGHRDEAQVLASLDKTSAVLRLGDGATSQKVDVAIHGTSSSYAVVEVHNGAPTPLSIIVPAGTLLVAKDSTVKNMLTTRLAVIDVLAMEDRNYDVPMIEVSLPDTFASEKHQFTAQSVAKDSELALIARAAAMAGRSRYTQLAVAWIVSDDADYATLGKIVQIKDFNPATGERIIKADHIAAALRLLDEVGIDTRDRRIWSDWQLLYDQAETPQLRAWLTEHRPR